MPLTALKRVLPTSSAEPCKRLRQEGWRAAPVPSPPPRVQEANRALRSESGLQHLREGRDRLCSAEDSRMKPRNRHTSSRCLDYSDLDNLLAYETLEQNQIYEVQIKHHRKHNTYIGLISYPCGKWKPCSLFVIRRWNLALATTKQLEWAVQKWPWTRKC